MNVDPPLFNGGPNTDPPDRMGNHTNYPNRPSDCCEPKNP